MLNISKNKWFFFIASMLAYALGLMEKLTHMDWCQGEDF
jgi:hypothetical protein